MLFPQEESGQNRALRVNKVGFENGEITCSFKWIISIFAHKFVDGHNCMVKKNKNPAGLSFSVSLLRCV